LLTACVQTTSEQQDRASVLADEKFEPVKAAKTVACPNLIQYSEAEREQVATEIETHGEKVPGMVSWIDDYGRTRSAIRVCHDAAG
jgi:hypothetical protein